MFVTLAYTMYDPMVRWLACMNVLGYIHRIHRMDEWMDRWLNQGIGQWNSQGCSELLLSAKSSITARFSGKEWRGHSTTSYVNFGHENCHALQPTATTSRLTKVSGHGMMVFKQALIIEPVGSSSFNLCHSTTKRRETRHAWSLFKHVWQFLV